MCKFYMGDPLHCVSGQAMPVVRCAPPYGHSSAKNHFLSLSRKGTLLIGHLKKLITANHGWMQLLKDGLR